MNASEEHQEEVAEAIPQALVEVHVVNNQSADDQGVMDVGSGAETAAEPRNYNLGEYENIGPRPTCVVCMEDLLSREPRALLCNHVVCNDCIKTIIKLEPVKRICPVCRYQIKRVHSKPLFFKLLFYIFFHMFSYFSNQFNFHIYLFPYISTN